MLILSVRQAVFLMFLLMFVSMAGMSSAVAADKDAIIGRWDVVRSGENKGKDVAGYMRFKADGTFTSTLLFLATEDGKYKFVSNKVIQLDFPGVFYGRNKVEFKYTINGKILNLKEPQRVIDLEFEKIDSGS